MVVLLTPGQQHEHTLFEAVMEQGQVQRLGPGRPRLRPRRIAADKGYSFPRICRYLRRYGIREAIPRGRLSLEEACSTASCTVLATS